MKNLLGRLLSRPYDELRVISNAWGALTRDPNPSHNDLAIAVYHAMVDPSAARSVWESLDPETRDFVLWLLEQRNLLALADDLPGTLNRPPEEVGQVMESARRVGILDVDEALVRGTRVVSSGDNLYAWGARNQGEAVRRRVVSISSELGKVLGAIIEESRRPAPFEETFSALLQGLDQEQVQRIAHHWKLPEATRYYKSELIGVMNEYLATMQGRNNLLATLSPASQNLFEYLMSHGGRARASEVRTSLEWDEREFRSAALPLVQRALVWDVLEGNSRWLFLAADLASDRAATAERPSGVVLPKLDTTPPYSIESRLPYQFAWDLLTLLAAASENDLSLTLQDNRITKRVAKRLNEAFLQPEDIKAGTPYIDMIVHAAQTLGLLVENQDEQPALTLSPKANDWAALSFSAQRHRFLALWLEDRKWAEPATYGTIYWWNSDLTDGRKHLVQHLLELPVGQWISVDAFLRKIHLVEPFIIWSQEELVRRFGLRALQGFRNQWFNIEGRIVGDMVKTMLLWLGAVEVGRDKQKRFVSFRVTEEGRALLDPQDASDSGRPAKTLLVQPNFEVLVLHPESQVLWDLMRSANLIRHDRVSAYVITRESVVRAIESGLTADQIHAFLDANTGKGLPQNVAHSIQDWARLVKRATIRRATLIEVDDPSVLDELAAARRTRKYVLQRLTPTVAVAALPEVGDSARDDAWQKLLKELKGAGFTPRFEDEILPVAPAAATNGTANGAHVAPRKKAATRTRKVAEPKVGAAAPRVGGAN